MNVVGFGKEPLMGADEKAIPKEQLMNRSSKRISVNTPSGVELIVDLNDELKVSQLKEEIAIKTGIPPGRQTISQQGVIIDDKDSVKENMPVEVLYALSGGAAFEVVKKMPDLIQERCLCYKCGIKDFPKWQTEDFVVSDCCCITQRCGFSDMMRIQYFCLVLDLKPVGFKVESKMPDLIREQCFCQKCGLKKLPDFQKEDFVVSECFCLFSKCGFSEMNIFQCFCLKLTV